MWNCKGSLFHSVGTGTFELHCNRIVNRNNIDKEHLQMRTVDYG